MCRYSPYLLLLPSSSVTTTLKFLLCMVFLHFGELIKCIAEVFSGFSLKQVIYFEKGKLRLSKIKQQPGVLTVLEVHLQYLPRSGQFVPNRSYCTLVQLYYSLCKLKCKHWTFVYPQLRTGARKSTCCWVWMSAFIISSDVQYYIWENSFHYISISF